MTTAGIRLAAVNNSCCCCFSTNSLKQMMLGDYSYTDGKLETYAQMFTSCFKIEFMTDSTEYDYLICQKCIDLLQQSYTFINQVVKAQASLQNRIVQTGSIKIEPHITLDDTEANKSKPITLNVPLDNNLSIKEEKAEDLSDYDFNDSEELDDEPDVPKTKSKIKNDETDSELNNENCNGNDLFKCTINNTDTYKIDSLKLVNNIFLNIGKESKVTEKSEFIKSHVNLKSEKGKKLPYKLEKGDLTCKICNETFTYHTLLARHMCVHFPNYVCDTCGKVFSTRSQLRSHLHSHDLSEHKCNTCNRKIRGAQNLRVHIRQYHKTPLVYKCPHCPERFNHMSYHKRLKHLVEVHNDEPKKHKCELCPQRFSETGGLRRHIRIVHLSERNYTCSECSSTFFCKSGLRNHMLTHTGHKTFECDVCHKSYGRRSTLNEHMKIHNNIKKFICQICNKAFTQKCSLKGHMKTHADV